jgi:hypothetical protein
MSYHYATTIIEHAKNEFDELLEDCMTHVNIMELMIPDNKSPLFGWISDDCIVIDESEYFVFDTYFLDRFNQVEDVEHFNGYVILSDKSDDVKKIIAKFNEKS